VLCGTDWNHSSFAQYLLEIDLDQVQEEKQNACGGKTVGRNDSKQMLCK
jgi:hypothetical protein